MQVLFDFEQIDVARGPQGTLEGAPNLGGMVNLKRRNPTDEFDVDVRASFGNYRRREYDVAVNFPITKSIAGKITYAKKEDGGKYMNNVTIDRSENKEDRIATSVALQAKFGGVTANYIYDDEQDDADTPALLNLSTASDQLCIQSGASEDTCAFARDVPQTTSKILTAQNFSNERDYDGEYHTLTLDFYFRGYEVTNITGVRETSEQSNHDMDASQIDFYSATRDQQ
tara:strand:+ start:1148 stop:1831 length:684 start_codon:yes stop_codon:yes gene_type:complete